MDYEYNIEQYLDLGQRNSQSSCVSPTSSHLSNHESALLPTRPRVSKYHEATEGSSRDLDEKRKVALQATAKYRERKKKQVQELEQSVRELEEEIKKIEQELSRVKDNTLEKLSSAAKSVMQTQDSENVEIFTELEILAKSDLADPDADIDKVNLLLDTLKCRIGPTGRERQAKLTYHFKNIVNTLFPALHRYLMSAAIKKADFFDGGSGQCFNWTHQLKNKLQLTPQQENSLYFLNHKLAVSHKEVMNEIQTLLSLKQALREEGLRFDSTENEFRGCMSPIQCARWILWCEKNKYHQDIFLQQASMHFYESQAVQLAQHGRKRVHRSN